MRRRAVLVLVAGALSAEAATSCATPSVGVRGTPPGEQTTAGRDAEPDGGREAPDAAASPLSAPTGAGPGPFVFTRGSPQDYFAAYVRDTWGAEARFPPWGSRGDVTGGPALEPLIPLNRHVIVEVTELGGFWRRDLGANGNVAGLEARRVTGGPNDDIVARYWVDDGHHRHDLLEIWSIPTGGAPIVRFVHEVGAIADCCGSEANAPPHVFDDVVVVAGEVRIKAGRPWRADAKSFVPAALPGVPSVLLPWDGVTVRAFRWDGARFVETAAPVTGGDADRRRRGARPSL